MGEIKGLYVEEKGPWGCTQGQFCFNVIVYRRFVHECIVYRPTIL